MRHACFDGLVGGTHCYAGLASGNLASLSSAGRCANPRAAALQGLEKMNAVRKRGILQGILPPHERPQIGLLRELGFDGSAERVLEQALRRAPHLLAAASSASAMWAANAATVTPAADSADGRTHLTPANLSSTLHRSLEAEQTARALRRLFPDPDLFLHHPPLPSALGDEGAANHTRLVGRDGKGTHLFVYGRSLAPGRADGPHRFSARQHREASEAIARRHGLDPKRCLFLRQASDAIDAGVFHADVCLVGEARLLLYHEDAFAHAMEATEMMANVLGVDTALGRVMREELSINEAVESYLFNSQLVPTQGDALLLVAPIEAQKPPRARAVVERWIADPSNPIDDCIYVDLRQSMQNGGGPACLRLRVALEERELQALHTPALLDDELYERLVRWVERHHRDRLRLEDLADPKLLDETRVALDELTTILELGGDFYPFQR